MTSFQAETLPKLVVLSACKTALGDMRDSEGVFGLQRAFKTAGAGYLLTSLWLVSDQATSDLMARFHRNWKRYEAPYRMKLCNMYSPLMN